MNYPKQHSTYLSNILLLGLALNKVPLSLIQPLLSKAMKIVHSKHPALFQRIAETNFDYTINAYDLPFIFYLNPSAEKPILKAIKRSEDMQTSAIITGSLENLLKIVEGTIDGDADFFSGNLIIEGNTAAVVHLRNAIDSEDINIINDLSEILPASSTLLATTFHQLNQINQHWQNKLNIITNAITWQVHKKIQDHANIIDDISSEIDEIKKELKKYKKEDFRKKSDYSA